MVHFVDMTIGKKKLRQSVSLPLQLARRVRTIAKSQRTSTNRVLIELIESGIELKDAENANFFRLTDRLSTTSNAEERNRIKKELARSTFGE